LITRFLTTLGLDVITARDGKEVLDLYEECKPQVILLDIQMPEMDGLEAFAILRQKGCTIPIIALTANAMAHEIEHYLELGFDGHLKKPIERKQFITTLAKYYGDDVCHKEANDTINKVDLSDLVAQFKSNLVLEQQDIILHMKKDDLTELAALAHRIAGAAQMFGFALLSEKAVKLELAIKANKTSEINQFTQKFLNEIDQILW
jgi:CheY-like chemotaxis protein/HPt (histidine-containing phosphotransfer) domain-containing protein